MKTTDIVNRAILAIILILNAIEKSDKEDVPLLLLREPVE